LANISLKVSFSPTSPCLILKNFGLLHPSIPPIIPISGRY